VNGIQTIITTTLFLPLLFGYGGGEMNTIEMYTKAEIADANYVVQRVDGVWAAMGVGTNSTVKCFVASPDNVLYAGGLFTTAGGNAAALVASWDGATWAALGDGLSGGVSPACHALAYAPNGILYAAGEFDTAGSVAAIGLAYWDGTDWFALGNLLTGAGADGVGYALARDTDGNLYVGGLFATVGGTAAVNIAKWDGSAWSALGAGCNNYVTGLLWGKDGCLYASGVFTEAGGVAAVGIAKWNGTTWAAVGGDCAGGSAAGYAITQRANGEIVLGGSFTSVAGISANNIAAWNGSSWRALGVGCNAGVETLGIDEDGMLIVGGVFTAAGGISVADRVALYNWSTWQAQDIDLPGVATVYAVTIYANRLYLGFNTSGTALAGGSGAATVNNEGSAYAYPKIAITRSGGTSARLESIQNLTTGTALLFNWALQDGEKVTIELAPGHKTVTSSASGNALNKLLNASDFGSFCLIPGVNDIRLYISETGSPTLTAFIQWETQYSSLDGAAS